MLEMYKIYIMERPGHYLYIFEPYTGNPVVEKALQMFKMGEFCCNVQTRCMSICVEIKLSHEPIERFTSNEIMVKFTVRD